MGEEQNNSSAAGAAPLVAGHTPGPWTNQNMEEGHLAIIASFGPDCTLVALVDHIDGDEAQELANARLIAAAPDLLAALEWIAEDGASDARAVECARDAITKAKAA